MTETKKCSICGHEYPEWGNNAQPINAGRCCDLCNNLVINHRLAAIRRHEQICSICGDEHTGFGNNADPINAGRCCDSCNDLVIARRMADSGASKESILRVLDLKEAAGLPTS